MYYPFWERNKSLMDRIEETIATLLCYAQAEDDDLMEHCWSEDL